MYMGIVHTMYMYVYVAIVAIITLVHLVVENSRYSLLTSFGTVQLIKGVLLSPKYFANLLQQLVLNIFCEQHIAVQEL